MENVYGRWEDPRRSSLASGVSKALIISTRVCSIACTYTRVNGRVQRARVLREHTHTRPLALATYVHTPCVLRTHKPRLWVSVNSNR